MPLPTIREVPAEEIPLELLLLADPSEKKVRSYLFRSRCFVASVGGEVVGACAVEPRKPGTYELMSIAVRPEAQRRGIGAALLGGVVDLFREEGADRLEVGTGSFGYQLAFYQRHGFRVMEVDRDFFVRNYDGPIFEDGIRLRDMLRLAIDYREEVGSGRERSGAVARPDDR
jgi:ribosomal protein S18 acetylase RimI-like enzyme